MNEIIEKLSEAVHDAWWEEKRKQGFHAPANCVNADPDNPIFSFNKFQKYCDKCHTDMYPYEELPENVKEYDRVTVRTVLKALGEAASE